MIAPELALLAESHRLPTSRHTSSVDILPSELLAYIFEIGHRANERYRILPFPILASHISNRWRMVALSSPTLWTDIRLSAWGTMDLWLLFLHRSGCAPLDVLFRSGPLMGYKHNPAALRAALTVLLSHIHRVRTLSIVTDRQDVLSTIISTLAYASAPQLETFEMNHYPQQWWNLQERPMSIFSGRTPRLSTVRVKRVAWDYRSTHLSSLTTLDLAAPYGHEHLALPLADFTDLAKAAPKLTHLALGGAPVLVPRSSHTRVCFPSLASLELALAPDAAYSATLCALLDVPALKTLAITQNMSGFVAALCATRGGYPGVKALSLARIEKNDLELLNVMFLDAFPAVEELSLISFDTFPVLDLLFTATTDDLPRRIYALNQDYIADDGQIFWPNLKCISLEKWPMYDMVSPHMLTARRPKFTEYETAALCDVVSLRSGQLKVVRLQPSAFAPELLERLSEHVLIEKMRELEPVKEEYYL